MSATDSLYDRVTVSWAWGGSVVSGFTIWADGQQLNSVSDPALRSWDDMTSAPGVPRAYHVTAIDACGNNGLPSDSDTGMVIATPHHYVSPYGNNVYPYASAVNAAHLMVDAIGAAETGDSVLVETATYSNVSFTVDQGIGLYGAWDSTFTYRDVENGKAILNLQGNISIMTSDKPVVFDGFVVQGGTGTHGGGLNIEQSDIMIGNSVIRQNVASNGSFGYGGGIYALQSTIQVVDCYISSNNAMQGGGIYFDGCSGTISNTAIMGNGLVYGTVTPRGGGVCLTNCSGVAFSDNVITGNSTSFYNSEAKGGGVCVLSSTNITVDGDVITYNEAGMTGSGGYGGGVHIEGSDVSMSGVTISHNQAKLFGGGINADGASTVALMGSKLMWNSALIGGGGYLVSSITTINHNLIVGNNGTACYISGPSSGSFVGNTMDRNSGTTTGGALLIFNTSIPLFNNIVVNSSGDGIRCSGATTPTPEYNDVWNNSGSDYVGCTPGTGSISVDPIFVDTSAVDYHLGLHSPSIDAGDPDPGYNDPDGSCGDMGIYGSHAFTMDQPIYPKDLTASIVSGDVLLNWSANPELDVSDYAVYKDTTQQFVPSDSNFVELVAAENTAYNDGPSAVGVSYYKICAVDTSGYASGYSIPAEIQATYTVTVATDPDGLEVMVNGVPYIAPRQFGTVAGAVYEIAVDASQEVGDSLFVFTNWSDGGARAHTVVVPDSSPVYTAYFSIFPKSALIDSVTDIPDDQGGWVRIHFARSGYDSADEELYPIAAYNVWRRIGDAMLAQTVAEQGEKISTGSMTEIYDGVSSRVEGTGGPQLFSDLPITRWQNRYFCRETDAADSQVAEFPPGTWELMGRFASAQLDHYIYAAPTLGDSTEAGIAYTVYAVSAHTTTPSIWYMSPPDSGFSVDNMAPGMPQGFVVAYGQPDGTELSWDPCEDADFQFYRIYRGESADFDPTVDNLLQITAETEWLDPVSGGYHYKVTSVDDAGNESEPASPDNATSVENPVVPTSTALYQNVPNPFNPVTTIRFDLPVGSNVRLDVFSATGALIRNLVSQWLPARQHEYVWDGRDGYGNPVSSGVYFYRLATDNQTFTKKMVFLK